MSRTRWKAPARPLPRPKGAVAEGARGEALTGRAKNIRSTVANAESYQDCKFTVKDNTLVR